MSVEQGRGLEQAIYNICETEGDQTYLSILEILHDKGQSSVTLDAVKIAVFRLLQRQEQGLAVILGTVGVFGVADRTLVGE